MNLQKNRPMYKIYATLLDAYQYYLKSEDDGALQELLDKINRVPFESEAADKGTAFNEVVDTLLHSEAARNSMSCDPSDMIYYPFVSKDGTRYNFEFKKSIVLTFVNSLEGYVSQVPIGAHFVTTKGQAIYLYGYIDEILRSDVTDIKTTSKYEFPKFLNAWQHRVYPYCLDMNGIVTETFTYRITDFNGYYEEVYTYDRDKCIRELSDICERFIDFLELNRDKITDLKVFGND